MLIEPVRYIFAPIRLQGPVFTALPGCRVTALPLKRDVAPTPVVARLMAATSVIGFRLEHCDKRNQRPNICSAPKHRILTFACLAIVYLL
jgi:hypothetical protein